MAGIGYPAFLYTAEHIDFSQFDKGKLIKYTYFWVPEATDDEVTRYLELISDKFLPNDGQKLLRKTWARRKGHPKVVIVRVIYEVNP